MVLLIAALHALPIFFVAWKWSSKGLVWVTAILSAVVAFETGNPAYIIPDLVAIGISLWNCLAVINRRMTEAGTTPGAQLVTPSKPPDFARWIGGLVLIAILAFFVFDSAPQRQATTAPPPVYKPLPAQRPESNNTEVGAPNQPNVSQFKSKPTAESAQRSIQSCLRITSDEKMIRCLERTK